MTISPIAPASLNQQLETLTNLHSTGWLVLVCRGGAAVALELAQLGKPMLVVEADPEQVEELHQQLEEQTSSTPTVYCELLGPEIGETRWYCYNDARQNGTTGLEALQGHYPNLRLQSQGPRRLLRLEDVLTTWEGVGDSTGNGPLEGAGALLAIGVEALPLLQGGGHWLDRFSQLVVPTPLMESGGDRDAWSALLKSQCLQPSGPIPQSNGETDWILLEQDRERLLEVRLQLALDRISTVESDRDGLVIQQQELTSQCDSLSNKLENQRTELEALKAKHNALVNEQLELTAHHKGVAEELEIVKEKHEVLKVEQDNFVIKELELNGLHDGLIQQLNDLKAEQEALKTERDDFVSKQLVIIAERDKHIQQHEEIKVERDALIIKYQQAMLEYDELKEKRDRLQSKIERLAEVLKTSSKQLTSFKNIYSNLIVAHQETQDDK